MIPEVEQQKLFLAGPVNTTSSVKKAMLIDYGLRDSVFLERLQNIRTEILHLAGCDSDTYTVVLLQGSGTFAIEATLNTCVNKDNDKVLIVSNGLYGDVQADMLQRAGKQFVKMELQHNERICPDQVRSKLDQDTSITHVSLVHCESSTGMINPIDFLNGYSRPIHLIVDAVSSFGAYHIDAQKNKIDFVVATSYECLQGTPGIAFVIANKMVLANYRDNATSIVMDLVDEDQCMSKSKRFRFTPPTQVLAALQQALIEHKKEGGINGRFTKYQKIQKYLVKGMQEMGFKAYLDLENQGVVTTLFHEPAHPKYNIKDMNDFIESQNMILSSGSMAQSSTFSIASIGELTIDDVEKLMSKIEHYLQERNIPTQIIKK